MIHTKNLRYKKRLQDKLNTNERSKKNRKKVCPFLGGKKNTSAYPTAVVTDYNIKKKSFSDYLDVVFIPINDFPLRLFKLLLI